MGVAPGVKTDFYLYGTADFCAGMKNWTSHVLADDDAPLVLSVSYGFQAALGGAGGLGCTRESIRSIDADFAKLAAKGISIIVGSGDSGSGYKPDYCTKALKNDRYIRDRLPPPPSAAFVWLPEAIPAAHPVSEQHDSSLVGVGTAAVAPTCTLGYGDFPCHNETVDAATCCTASGESAGT